MRRLFLMIAIVSTFLLWPVAPTVQACPGCKEALFDPGEVQQKRSTAKGYALSIGLMLLVPAGLVSGVTLLVIRGGRR